VLPLDLLPPEIAGSAPSLPESHGLKQAVRAFEKRAVDRAITDTGGDHNAAARRLRVNAKYLYQLIRDLDAEVDGG
jgi:DNA-binding NtrC family response regulator